LKKEMSNRLNQEREKKLQPIRIQNSIEALKQKGITELVNDETGISFLYMDNAISFWPYSGWFSGKGIKQGRGLKKLLKQLK
jgi:hypothetical protein